MEIDSVETASAALAGQGYLADRPLSLAVNLAVVLEQPLLLEGEAGVGKTEVARALAAALGVRLIRLQCHEGLDLHHAVYDWDYSRQLLALRAADGGVDEGELHDALKRRCLYHSIDYPDAERERAIVHARLPEVPELIAARVVQAVGRLREQGDLYKLPSVGETIVWAQALLAVGDDAELEETLGVALKVREDVVRVREHRVLEGV